jgi:hypothetical protein
VASGGPGFSPGKKAMLNEAKDDNSRGKKQVLKLRGQKEPTELPDLKGKKPLPVHKKELPKKAKSKPKEKKKGKK